MVEEKEPDIRKEIVSFLNKTKIWKRKPSYSVTRKIGFLFGKVIKTGQEFKEQEIMALLTSLPCKYDQFNVSAQYTLKLLTSDLSNIDVTIRCALKDTNNDYRMLLAEWLCEHKFSFEDNRNLYCLKITPETYTSGMLDNINSITSDEADFMLAALTLKNDNTFYDFPYSKIYSLISHTDKYSDFSSFSLKSYHFDKFYTLRILAQYFSGADFLPLEVRKVILTHPPRGMQGSEDNPVLEEVTIPEYIAYGMRLKQHFEASGQHSSKRARSKKRV